MTQEPHRRSFLSWAIFALGAVFSAILGIPVVCYTIDPRHRKNRQSQYKLVDGIVLEDLLVRSPRQGVIRDTRRDGWTLYPSDVVGRVWVVRVGDAPTLRTDAEVDAYNADETRKKNYLLVFTTICPHMGCSVNLDETGNEFACPCHNATFKVDGAKGDDPGNPAPRGMDTLDWQIDKTDPKRNRILVKYQNFKASVAEKQVI